MNFGSVRWEGVRVATGKHLRLPSRLLYLHCRTWQLYKKLRGLILAECQLGGPPDCGTAPFPLRDRETERPLDSSFFSVVVYSVWFLLCVLSGSLWSTTMACPSTDSKRRRLQASSGCLEVQNLTEYEASQAPSLVADSSTAFETYLWPTSTDDFLNRYWKQVAFLFVALCVHTHR